MDIKNYLVHETSFITREQLKSYNALEAHNYLTSGWVQEPRLKVLADSRVVIIGRVLHSQSLSEQPLHPWLLIKEDGQVQAAHCTCKAGLGEACSHIGAVLFYIEAAVKRRDGQACTDKENAWLPPPVRLIEPKPASHVSFSSPKMKKRIIDGETPSRGKLRRVNVQPTTDEEWSEFLLACHKSGSRPALLSLEPKYADNFIPVATKFPSAMLTNMLQNDQPTTWSAVMEQCSKLAQNITVETQLARLIEECTREQAKCTKWFAFRTGRITASNAKAVCRTSLSDPAMSLLRRICYPEATQFWSPQTAWGKEHEGSARDAYKAVSQDIHVNFICRDSGLQISTEQPFPAASPDGIINCTCCKEGVLEIKCPFNGRDECARALATLKNSCITIVDGAVKLKEHHPYYYQVQMQMYVCKANYCNFVLWTLKDFIVIRVYKDAQFCDKMVKRCEEYFKLILLPELCFHYWTDRSRDNVQETVEEPQTAQEQVYCFCQEPESGKMVMCENAACRYVWFHFKCVSLKKAPRGSWYCSECKKA
ncbi:uncharacterized protein LOC144103258 [Amblyomma americanum]